MKEYTDLVFDNDNVIDEAASSKTYTVEKIIVVKKILFF